MLRLIAHAAMLIAALPAFAQEPVSPEPILLWPQGAPGAKGTEPADTPELRLYLAPQQSRTGAMVVVCPGGGYGVLASDHEGQQVARWLNSIGVSAAVVKYRLGPRYHHPAPLQDAQRAIRYVRAHAQKLSVDPHRVGIMGFSAGGHLASTVSTHYDDGDASSEDPLARESSRPDFAILAYPVISFQSPFTHKGSMRNLLGENPDPQLVKSLSNETQVTADTPPTFLFHTAQDKGVPVQNSLVYYSALIEHGVPAELHVYQQGPHGVGLAPGNPVLSSWKERLADWLKVNGVLKPLQRKAVSGAVKLDGEPLRWGAIAFSPEDPLAPSAWAMVSRGNFRFTEVDGPVAGVNRVSVWNMGDVQSAPTLPDAGPITGPVETTPLTVDVHPDGKNLFHFDLTSPK